MPEPYKIISHITIALICGDYLIVIARRPKRRGCDISPLPSCPEGVDPDSGLLRYARNDEKDDLNIVLGRDKRTKAKLLCVPASYRNPENKLR